MLLQAEQPDHSEGTTSAYRAYEIGPDGRVRNSTVIDATSDDDATDQMRRMMFADHSFELWDRSRMVIRLPAKGS